MLSFASDNNSGAHPAILQALTDVNGGTAFSYGADPVTFEAQALLAQVLGAPNAEVNFVYNGTAANVLATHALCKPYHSALVSDVAHLHTDECGAAEHYNGIKLTPIASVHGKITPDALQRHLVDFGNEHRNQPRILSLTQPTEYGTLYTPDDVRTLAELAHRHGLLVHMDGARLANAAAALGVPFAEFTHLAGVDVLSFGATKNGCLAAEAVVFFRHQERPILADAANDFRYIRKQGMQLASKMRFISAQFRAYLSHDLYLHNARHANAMARLLADLVADAPGLAITQPVQSNVVFATLPPKVINRLHRDVFFYIWDIHTHEVRWMFSFDTPEADVRHFAHLIRQACQAEA